MDLNLKDKAVLITGGSRGIGLGIARAFLAEGARVGIAARGMQSLLQAREELGPVGIYQVDVTQEKERTQFMHKFIDDYGTIDVLVNNAGGSQGGEVLATDLSTFKDVLELNYYSAVHLSQLAAAEMKKKRSGSIVNISSIYGRESGGKAPYNNAKSALISFTKAFADEVIREGIRVNGVAPGSILHPSGNWQKRLDENPDKINQFVHDEIPAGRFGTVEEVAHTVVFLASEKASWVVGATLNVDGGQSRSNF